MDEVFWSNVVKRWSDASESVIKLKKELAELQKERAHYVSPVGDARPTSYLRGSQHFAHSEEDSVHLSLTSTTRDELQDAEAGLGRAKEEYRRLQYELTVSSERIQTLSLENENLCLKHQEEIARLHQTIQSLTVDQSENQHWHSEKTSGRGLEKANPHDITARSVSTNRKNLIISNPNEPLIVALQEEIEALKSSVEIREADNQELRHELTITQDRLHKSEENQKALLASIVKLQKITRNSALGALDHNLLHSDASRRSLRRISLSSNGSSIHNLEPKSLLRIKPSAPVDVRALAPPSHIDDRTIIEHDPANLNLQNFPEREKIISKLPIISYPGINQSENAFERGFLKCALGEGVQNLIEHFADNRTVDKKSITSSYLCPTLNHHPWCPSTPGQHGFIFVGLGKEKDAYNAPVMRNLFVGMSKNQTNKRTFRYLGKYKVSRVNSLTNEEWTALSPDVKVMYAKLTKEKEKDARSVDNIMLAYDKGGMNVPCVQLQCISFDSQLYAALVSWRKEGWKP